MDLNRIKAAFESGPGWRCLEELAGGAEFQELLEREFAVPPDATDGMGRRDFLRLLGGTLGLAGLAGLGGCTVRPRGKIVPYVQQPEQIVPGKPLYYASALEFGGFGRGVLVETHEGRPTKIEGNPGHPASLGATSLFEQAAILDLYNPARSTGLLKKGEAATWPAFQGELLAALGRLPPGGAGLHLLTGMVTSPTFAAQWQELTRRYPEARWHTYEPLNRDAEFVATTQAFGRPLNPQYRFDKARVVVSFGADFLFAMPGSVRYAHDLMARREQKGMSRLYAVESVPTITGTFADERCAVGHTGIADYASALAARLGLAAPSGSAEAAAWAARVGEDLRAGGGGVIIAGMEQPPEVHALIYAMNAALEENGAVGWMEPVEANPMNQAQSLRDLAEALHEDKVRVLLMLGGGNWARTAPGDLRFSEAMRRAELSVYCGLYHDDTARAATWHIPQAHALEAWGDTRAFDGTASIVQPMIEPLYGGRSVLEILDAVARPPGRSSGEIVREHWMKDEAEWRRALHDGVVRDTTAPWQGMPNRVGAPGVKETLQAVTASASSLELVFTPDGSLWDGRYAENVWLQELPRPISKLSWENALLISPVSAGRLGLTTGDEVRLRNQSGSVLEAPVLVQPGMAEGTVAIALGGGLWKSSGKDKGGTDAYPFRTSAEPWRCAVSLEKTGRRSEIAMTQHHHLVAGRDLLRIGTLAELEARYPTRQEPPPTLFNLTETMTDGNAWAMSIDLSRCIACNACMMACQAENNIPSVGREEVMRGREMHWIRIDSYYFGSPDAPVIAHQPVPCMHCELAPCEPVCPVAATVHDHGGLNLQIYNRCIGTRYCSNNCPYKVRRFNFFRYAEQNAREPLLLMANPDVTVRARGVMEKCTYCVQRISEARIRSSIENRAIRDGEVTPACAQVCPTGVIVFGNRNDPESRVAKRKQSPLDYALLEELNTRPRTTYLARVRNPLPSES